MLWLYLISAAIAFGLTGLRLRRSDEVYAIAATAASAISITWGFAWAPPAVQLVLIGLALGWLQASRIPCDSKF
ncbi:hypothetical protein IQ268_01790 [Oculatella sp. LEGE 06141]|uniref:hypothetical protein n=1 Tax=Oculatella sp. LEGE 06141 TaxID=1828648 RepID=UPI0018827AB1|nr:hypothetical protein [Oculatella sp. LEGE 06141]MBE9177306.1 hypothetical protein [Oculatella sp. LEGE 06141]